MISPAKGGRLGAFHFCEGTTQLMKVDFWALSSHIWAFGTLKAIEVFPDGLPLQKRQDRIQTAGRVGETPEGRNRRTATKEMGKMKRLLNHCL